MSEVRENFEGSVDYVLEKYAAVMQRAGETANLSRDQLLSVYQTAAMLTVAHEIARDVDL